MIRYSLKCSEGHLFESWFQSAAAFDKLNAAGMISCAICGTKKVSKSLMAPNLGPTPSDKATKNPVLSTAESTAEKAIKALREHVEKTSENVGKDFAQEARKIHQGDAPERPIYGEATSKDAKSLLQEGVPVLPLPFNMKVQ